MKLKHSAIEKDLKDLKDAKESSKRLNDEITRI